MTSGPGTAQLNPSGLAAEGVAQLLRRITSALARRFFIGQSHLEKIHSISRAPSGHIYFDLKDAREDAHISCALFRGAASRLDFVPARGDSVVAEGEINIYAPRGQMNLVVKSLKRAGEGTFRLRFLVLKEKLLAEGLFDVSRKKALPLYQRRIGIVTSPEAAALRDAVRTILLAGAAVDIILYPARVQGEGALAELCAALRDADFRAECDVILLVRGGGALADLWTYNEETLAPGYCGTAYTGDFGRGTRNRHDDRRPRGGLSCGNAHCGGRQSHGKLGRRPNGVIAGLLP